MSTIVCKDHVTGHNPVAVLHGQGFSYKRLQKQKLAVPEDQEPLRFRDRSHGRAMLIVVRCVA